MHRDGLTWFDEVETSNSNDLSTIINFLYSFTQGIGKSRGTKQVTMRQHKTFRGVLLTTAEKDISSIVNHVRRIRTAPRGMFRRVLELKCDDDMYSYFDSDNGVDVRELNAVSRSNFGHFALRWIEHVERNMERVKELYASMMKKPADPVIADTYAVMLTVSHLIDKMVGIDTLELREYLSGVMESHVRKITHVRDIGQEMVETLLNEAVRNANKIIGSKNYTDERSEIWGRIDDRRHLVLISSIVDRIAKENGIVLSQALDELEKKGIVAKNGDGRFVKKISLNGLKVWGYTFRDIFSDEVAVDPF